MSRMNFCDNKLMCPDGNCIGCQDGQVWCQDPRCQPYCPQCEMPRDADFNANIVIVIILMCLIAILFIVWFAYGPSLFRQHNNPEEAGLIMPAT